MAVRTSGLQEASAPRDDPRDDRALLTACGRGDQAAWAALINRYSRLIYAVAVRQGLGDEDAADAFQQVCLILYEKVDTLRDVEKLASWLITTTQREVWRMRAKRSQHAALDVADDFPDAMPYPDELAERLERQQLVHMALARAPERCKMLLHALFLRRGALSYQQIAASLGIPVPSIGPTRARCLKKLAAELERLGLPAADL
jgi:RNA polymerase sigma factor (sigma-70 family)